MTDRPLPALVQVTQSFVSRLPSQRVLDQLRHCEPATPFGELAETQPFRIVAFRALMRDFPDRDITSLWLHAYDVEVDIVEADPTNGKSATPSPPSAATTAAFPTTSTG
jgi:hypothetical protein